MKFLSNYFYYILSILAIILGLSEAWNFRWLCDDAFISFTYARNFSEGLGLVYQAGEFVEGYSNFLWTILLSFFMLFHFSPLVTSQVLGIFFYLLLLVYFYHYERKSFPTATLPIFVIHLALFYHAWIFATSGLETMMFTFFLSVGLVAWQRKEEKAGIFFLLAALSRPEGILFLGLHLISQLRYPIRLKSLLPFLGILLFLLFRFLYYGDVLPNTFYAKANRSAYFSQGFYYFLYWIRVYPIYIPSLLMAIYILLRNLIRKEHFVSSSSVLLYIFYVLYVGGDFMAMRFWMPIIPYLSWIVYQALVEKATDLQISSHLTSRGNQIFQKNIFMFYFIFILSLAAYFNPFRNSKGGDPLWNQIGEERRFYENSLSLGTGYDPEGLRHFRVAFFGAQAHFIYFMRPAYAWEAETGLTDAQLAKEKVNRPRGRVGHERVATIDGLLQRNIDLILADRFPELALPFLRYQFRNFDWHIFVLKYDAKKMKILCKRDGWDCSLLYKELIHRNLDIEKDHILWHD